jgi:hypothetical protein
MSTWDGGFSPAQNFHPEFGYLCPSARFRRNARIAAITLAAGALIVTSMALALLPQLAPQPPGAGGREESVLSSMALPPTIDKAADPKATSLAEEGIPAATMARAVATERAFASHAQAVCDDLSGSFLAPQCQLGKTGKSHAAHAAHDAGNRGATVSIGRAEAAPQVEPPEAAPRETSQELPRKVAVSRPAGAAKTAATAVATNEAPAAVMPPSKQAASVKKPAKIAQKQAPSRDVASADSPAAPPSPGFNLFALFHQPPRTGNGFWAMQ